MSTSSQQSHSDAFAIAGKIRNALRTLKKAAIAGHMDKDDTWVQKVESGQSGVLLDDIPRLLNALGYKIVASDRVCVDRETYNAVMVLHAKLAPRIPDLIWEDAE